MARTGGFKKEVSTSAREQTALRDAALGYGRSGWQVFPCHPPVTTHLRKGEGAAIYRAMGSLTFLKEPVFVPRRGLAGLVVGQAVGADLLGGQVGRDVKPPLPSKIDATTDVLTQI